MAEAKVTNSGAQFRLHAYVCGNACVQHVENLGTMTFTMIFVKRPANCRYAVVSFWDVARHADRVIVWDLYETQERIRTGKLLPPPPLYDGDCVDAAIMATAMTYQED